MPLLYGEGHKAFHRLQQEIIRSTYDHTILAWGLYASPSSQLQYIGGTNREAPPLFAPGPNAFDNWNPANRTLSEGKHYVFTNLGLYIDLVTVPFHTPSERKKSVAEKRDVAPSLALALLDCYEWSPGGRYRVALPLQLYDRGSSYTAPLARRARSTRPFLVAAHVDKLGKQMSMYLQDGIRAKNVQSNAMWSINCQALFSKGYILDDYFPPTHVDIVHDGGARNTTLCLYSEPGTEYSLLRLRHDEYSTVLLLIEHPKAATRLTLLRENSADQVLSKSQTQSTASENQTHNSSGMAQLWITSTDDMKTAFEMVLQPSHDAISFQYILTEFQWTSLGNIASSIATTSSSPASRASVPSQFQQTTAAFRHSASSSLSATPYPILTGAVHDSEQVKTIDAGVLEQIGALQVIDPALFDEDDKSTQAVDPSIDDLHSNELLGIAGTEAYAQGRQDRERAERMSMVIDLAMRVQEKTWHYAVNRPL